MPKTRTPEEALEDFKIAAAEGRVEVLGSDTTDEDVLLSDGHESLVLVRDVHLDGGAFGIQLQSPGSFSTILCVPEQWQAMKEKVDKFLAERKM